MISDVLTKDKKDVKHAVFKTAFIGLIVNLLLTLFKFIGGIIGGSQAVVADAFHGLSDLLTDLTIIVGVHFWSKPPDQCHPHGHNRLETLITLTIGVVLAFVGLGIIANAVITIPERHTTPPSFIAFWAAFTSLVTKEILYQWTVKIGRRVKSMSTIANAWHHRSDALSSIPAVIAVSAAVILPEWSFIDHIGAVIVALFIFQAAYKIITPSFNKLIDSGAPAEVIDKIETIAMETEGVQSVHKIRSRYISSSSLAVDLHIEVDGTLSVKAGHNISERVKERLLDFGPDIVDVVVHLEPFPE
ncbi:cation transporter [bacterium]|nr:cation transporter [candidate division CSSED10-310 bacterium]